jgi:hypothetical protein
LDACQFSGRCLQWAAATFSRSNDRGERNEQITDGFGFGRRVALLGCGEQKSEAPDKEGLSLQLPGVDVELEKGKGLEIKTPGTDVTVNREDVNVTAPNAEFEAKAKKGE